MSEVERGAGPVVCCPETLLNMEEESSDEIKAGLLEAVGSIKTKRQAVRKQCEAKVYEKMRKSERLTDIQTISKAPDLSERALYQKAFREAMEAKKRKQEEYKPSKKKIVKVIAKKVKSSKPEEVSESDSESDSESERSPDEKTPYEIMIEKRRAEHRALLEELKLNEIKADLLEAVGSIKTKRQAVRKQWQPKVYEKMRKSERLADIQTISKAPDFSERALYQKAFREAIEAKEKKEPEALPIPSDLSFKEGLCDEECYEGCMKNIICQEVKSDQKFYVYDKPVLKDLSLKESNIAKVTPSKIFAASWCPVEKLIIAAGDTSGNYGIWNLESESEPYQFRIHRSGVTCMQFNPYNPAQIVSSSYDGTVRCCDVTKQMFTAVYDRFSEVECTYFDYLSESTYIVSQSNGEVILVYYRSRDKPEKKYRLHQSSIRSVNVHPVNKNIFVTASKDKEIHLWDSRNLRKKPISRIRHIQKSINSAFFSPVTGNSLLTTLIDVTICNYDTTSLTGRINFKACTRPKCFNRKSFSVIRATWLPNSDDTFVVGCVDYPHRVLLYNSSMNIYHTLMDEKLRSGTSVNIFHPFRQAFAGCHFAGRISVFT